MSKRLLPTVAAFTLLLNVGAAHAQVRITEWMYTGVVGEFIELTNIGNSPIDMTGWSYDDDSRSPGAFSLSGFGIVAAQESVVLTEATAAAFRTEWSLAPAVKVLGGYTNPLGRNDEINIYDAANAIIDRLTYGDQTFPGTIRTDNNSGNPLSLAALGANDPSLWELATIGDFHGSYLSALGDRGNPGVYVVPEPSTVVLGVAGGLLALAFRQLSDKTSRRVRTS